MYYYRFFNEMVQRWQDKPWLHLDDVTPYNLSHRHQRGCLPCVGEFHFNRYCGKHGWCTSNWNIYKESKRKKLYWRLHPEFRRW